MTKFKKKKSLGQHFLNSEQKALEIVGAFCVPEDVHSVLEIGPGLGVLSRHLVQNNAFETYFSEIDERAIAYLKKTLHIPGSHFLSGDFLRADLSKIPGDFAVIGNFPYSISSQILFRVIDNRMRVPLVTGMFQREMARRVCAANGNRDYGILSIFVQAYYRTEYLFELPPSCFDPPPKVFSAVIRITRYREEIPCPEKIFRSVVKTAFGQRRKMLRNVLQGDALIWLEENHLADKRAEALPVETYIALSNALAEKA